MKFKLEKEVATLREDRKALVVLKEKLKVRNTIVEELNQKKSKVERAMLDCKSLLEKETALFELTLQSIPEDAREYEISC